MLQLDKLAGRGTIFRRPLLRRVRATSKLICKNHERDIARWRIIGRNAIRARENAVHQHASF